MGLRWPLIFQGIKLLWSQTEQKPYMQTIVKILFLDFTILKPQMVFPGVDQRMTGTPI